MKKVVLMLTLALAINFSVTAQKVSEKDVPVAVVSKFKSMFPNQKVKWENEKGNFEANFEQHDIEMSALFDASGNLLSTESEIKISELPKSVTDYVAKNYPGSKIKEAARITDAKTKVVTYEAGIKGLDLIFDLSGNFIKSEKD